MTGASPADPLPGLALTAVLVAGARAAESARPDRLIDDPFAGAFVDAASAASPAIARALAAGAQDETIAQVRRDAVAVRTRVCDDALLAAVRAGIRQVLLLAAGLDARAFRLPWPAAVRLWELDQPEMFTFKERVLDGRGARPRCDRAIVPVDLREDWPAALRATGFDAARPSVWLIEGLLMYLDEGERDQLLDRVAALSSRGSRLTLDHRAGFFAPPPVTSPDDATGERAAARFGALAAAAPADPSLSTPESWLLGHGWRARVDPAAAITARYGRSLPPQLQAAPGIGQGWLASAERL